MEVKKWKSSILDEVILKIFGGGTPSRANKTFWFGEIPWITVKDLSTFNPYTSIERITNLGLKNSASNLIKAGTLIISTRMAVGKAVIYKIDVAINQDLKAILFKCDFNVQFAFFWFQYYKNVFEELGSGSTVKGLSLMDIKQMPIQLPPLPEQKAIATALSDIDALIESLDKLIEKKRNIKQAAMQELLTGKTRLPGFNDVWQKYRLGDNLTFLRNGSNSRADLTNDGPVKYLHYGDIHGCSSSILEPVNLPSLTLEKAKNLSRLSDGDLIFVDASEDLDGVGKAVEIVNTAKYEMVAGLHTIAVRFDKGVFADRFKAYLQFCPEFYTQLRRLAAGTKVYATNRKHIAEIEMQLPSTNEQKAIAKVFSDMDTEIESLEKRRTKTINIKQGMMQELLTGKTRLI